MTVRASTLLGLFVFAIAATVWVPLSIPIAGLNLRLSQAALPIVLVALLVIRPVHRVSVWSVIVFVAAVWWWSQLALWTLIAGPTYGHPGGRVLLMALNLIQGLAAYVLVMRTQDLRIALTSLLVSVTFFNWMLVGVSALHAAGMPVPGGWLAEETAPMYVDGQLVSGTIQRFVFGGVLAGCVSAAAAVAAFCLQFDPVWRGRRWLMVAGLSAVVGMLVGFSRQSIVSLAIGVAVTLPFIVRRQHLGPLIRLAGVAVLSAGVAVGLLMLSSTGRDFVLAFAGRAVQLVDRDAYATGTVGERAIIWSAMWRDVAENPFLGHGQDAYIQYMPLGEGSHNFPLEVLHSSGLFGFLGYVALHVVPPLLALALLMRGRLPDDVRVPLIATFGFWAAIVSASLTNLIYWNPLYWLAIALLFAAVRLTERRQS